MIWWPRVLPYIGTSWVYCDEFGYYTGEPSDWEVKVFVVAWFSFALIVYQFGLPQEI